MSNVKELERHLANPNVQAFLGMLRDAEGTSKGANPYAVYGGNAKNQLQSLDTPTFSSWGFKQTDGKKNTSTATGAYQFLRGTWNNLQKQYGFKDFQPHTQDLAAVALLKQNGALQHIVNGNFNTAVQKANKTWASLPGSPYAQKTRDTEYIQKSLSRYLGQPVDPDQFVMSGGQQGGDPQSGYQQLTAMDQDMVQTEQQQQPYGVLNTGEVVVPESQKELEWLNSVAETTGYDDDMKATLARNASLLDQDVFDVNFNQNRRSQYPTDLDPQLRAMIRKV